ncbi:MAG: TMEM175 family protein [Gaiellaceae bacterium]
METGRVEAFSDGVFAIAITLLILAVGVEQAIAEGSLEQQLLDLWPAYIAYGVSFLTVGIMWVNHHQVFRHFARVDRPLLLLNILLLMCISFTPFPTRVVAEHAKNAGDREAAAILYGITMTVTAICFFSVWIYGSRKLLRPDTDMREVSGITRSYLPGTPMYATATLIAFISPVASLVIFGALAIFYAISSSFFGRDPSYAAEP